MTYRIQLGPYYAAIGFRLAVILGADHVFLGQPVAKLDSDGKAHPHAALYPSPGWQQPLDVSGHVLDIPQTFQVTAAGGDVPRALRAVDRVREALTGYTPDVPGIECGPLSELDSYDPGGLAVDVAVAPARYYSPLLWRGLIWLPEGA